MTKAEQIISALSNRGGFSGWWDDIDEGTQHEIVTEIAGIIGDEVPTVESDDEIIAELETSNRWGANDQPALDVAIEYLTDPDLPIQRVRMDADDTLHIYTTVPLSTEQAMELGRRLDPDEFSDEGEYYRLWWD